MEIFAGPPTVCKLMAFWAVSNSCGQLFDILLGPGNDSWGLKLFCDHSAWHLASAPCLTSLSALAKHKIRAIYRAYCNRNKVY